MRKLSVLVCLLLAIVAVPTGAQTQHDRINARGTSKFDAITNTDTVTDLTAIPSLQNVSIIQTACHSA